MEINLKGLGVEELRNLFSKTERELQTALLNGASWEEVKSKRNLVTEIAIELHKKKFPSSGSPADTAFRTE